jgi:hypothetical protein
MNARGPAAAMCRFSAARACLSSYETGSEFRILPPSIVVEFESRQTWLHACRKPSEVRIPLAVAGYRAEPALGPELLIRSIRQPAYHMRC